MIKLLLKVEISTSNMGNTDGKTTKKDEEVLKDISNQCQISFEELKTEYEEWLANCKEDLRKLSNHVFRVYDTDSNNQISFKERHSYIYLI